MRGDMSGIAITRVTLTKLCRAMIPLPPINEQKRIVAKVDQLMTLCDKLQTQLKEAQETSAKLTAAAVANLTAA
jgi:type I restriction enzyme S subunit